MVYRFIYNYSCVFIIHPYDAKCQLSEAYAATHWIPFSKNVRSNLHLLHKILWLWIRKQEREPKINLSVTELIYKLLSELIYIINLLKIT